MKILLFPISGFGWYSILIFSLLSFHFLFFPLFYFFIFIHMLSLSKLFEKCSSWKFNFIHFRSFPEFSQSLSVFPLLFQQCLNIYFDRHKEKVLFLLAKVVVVVIIIQLKLVKLLPLSLRAGRKTLAKPKPQCHSIFKLQCCKLPIYSDYSASIHLTLLV